MSLNTIYPQLMELFTPPAPSRLSLFSILYRRWACLRWLKEATWVSSIEVVLNITPAWLPSGLAVVVPQERVESLLVALLRLSSEVCVLRTSREPRQ